MCTACCQTLQILLALSVRATCFGSIENPLEFKYVTLKHKNYMYIDIQRERGRGEKYIYIYKERGDIYIQRERGRGEKYIYI